jgi:hypothetical protein
VGATLALSLLSIALGPAPSASADHVVPRPAVVTGDAVRAEAPEDRFALAGGCYTLQSLASGRWVARAGDGWGATAPDAGAGEAFHLQATDLGRYLLLGAQGDFLAADGGGVTAAAEPSPVADWVVDAAGEGFSLVLPDDDRALTSTPEGELRTDTAPAGTAGHFAFRQRAGCAAWPEVQTNVTGEPLGGSTPWTQTRGYLDGHLHTMAFEFVGGRARCGRPWHPYGVEAALVDCPDHEPAAAARRSSTCCRAPTRCRATTPVGWPTFGYWPKHDSLTPRADLLQVARAALARRPAHDDDAAGRQRGAVQAVPAEEEQLQRDGRRAPAGPAPARVRALHRRAVRRPGRGLAAAS